MAIPDSMAKVDHDGRRPGSDVWFGERVRLEREAKGWSMADLASKLREAGLANYHPTTVGRLERGERPVRLSEALVLADVLNVALEHLVLQPVRDTWPLTFATEWLRRLTKRAARAVVDAAFWREEAQREFWNAVEALESGNVAQEATEEMVEAIEAARVALDLDIDTLVEELAGLPQEERQDRYARDGEYESPATTTEQLRGQEGGLAERRA